MQLALRPYVTTGVAIVGASVLVAAPITVTPPDIQIAKPAESVQIAQRTANVELTSLVSDLLTAFNTVATAGGNTAQVLLDATGKLPGSVALLVQAAIDNPELIPNLASALVYGFVNPFPVAGTVPLPGPPDFSLLVQLFGAISPVIGLLPPPLGPSGMNPGIVTEISVRLLGVLADALGVLPDPIPALPALGQAAADLPAFITDLSGAFSALASALGISIGGGDYVIEIPFQVLPPPAPPVIISVPIPIQGAAPFIGQAPALLLAVLGAAVDNPEDIPGLFSFVVNRLVGFPDLTDPDALEALITGAAPTSLLLSLSLPTILTLAQILPPPLGGSVLDVLTGGDPGLILSASIGLGTVLNELLGFLPDPVSPFPSSLASSSRVVEESLAQPGIPDADLGDVFNAVRGAAEGVLDGAEALPDRVALIVKTIAARPELAPTLLAGAANAQIEGLQRALAPIAGALIGNLPRELRAPVGNALGEVNAGIDGFQKNLQDAVTPDSAVKKQSEPQTFGIAGANQVQAAAEGPEVTPKKHRQRVDLNVFKLNPLDQNNKDGGGGAQVGGGDGTTSIAKHRPGAGFTPVRDLVKRITSGFDNKADDDSDAAPAATAGAAATG